MINNSFNNIASPRLPDDMIYEILPYLDDPKDLKSCMLVNKKCSEAVQKTERFTQKLWKHNCKRFGYGPVLNQFQYDPNRILKVKCWRKYFERSEEVHVFGCSKFKEVVLITMGRPIQLALLSGFIANTLLTTYELFKGNFYSLIVPDLFSSPTRFLYVTLMISPLGISIIQQTKKPEAFYQAYFKTHNVIANIGFGLVDSCVSIDRYLLDAASDAKDLYFDVLTHREGRCLVAKTRKMIEPVIDKVKHIPLVNLDKKFCQKSSCSIL